MCSVASSADPQLQRQSRNHEDACKTKTHFIAWSWLSGLEMVLLNKCSNNDHHIVARHCSPKPFLCPQEDTQERQLPKVIYLQLLSLQLEEQKEAPTWSCVSRYPQGHKIHQGGVCTQLQSSFFDKQPSLMLPSCWRVCAWLRSQGQRILVHELQSSHRISARRGNMVKAQTGSEE